MPKSREYWKKRFEKLEDDAYRASKAYYDDLAKQFRRASNEIEMEIASWYYRVAENNEISYYMAKRYLNRKELKEFRWTVEEYIKYGKENALDQKWMKELENASARVHITRLETIKLQLQQLVERLFIEYEGGTSDLLNKTFKSSYYKSAYEIAKGTGVGKNLHMLDDNLISGFLRKPWAADGADFSSRIWKNKDELVKNLHTELSQQLVRGSDPGKSIAALAKKMDVSKSKAGNLIMTETAAIHSMAQKQCFSDLDVEKYEIIVTMDIKTSQICRDIDKKYHNVGIDLKDYQVNVTAPPFHCRCRTCTCPFFDDEFTDGSTRIARDAVTGKTYQIPTDMTYQEWYDKYIVSDPDAILAERKLKNKLADQKQHDQYKSILGKDTPKKLDDFQNLKYTENEKFGLVKLDYSRRKNLIDNPELALPNADSVILPDEKFTKYLFSETNLKGKPKGDAFNSRLGYNISNWTELQNEIQGKANKYPAVFKDKIQYGYIYEQKMILYGKQDTPANVIVGWINKPDGTISMTTAYIKEVN